MHILITILWFVGGQIACEEPMTINEDGAGIYFTTDTDSLFYSTQNFMNNKIVYEKGNRAVILSSLPQRIRAETPFVINIVSLSEKCKLVKRGFTNRNEATSAPYQVDVIDDKILIIGIKGAAIDSIEINNENAYDRLKEYFWEVKR